MADIVGGTITVDGTTYTVILRPSKGMGAVSNTIEGGGKKSKTEKKGKSTRKLSPYMKFAQDARKNIIAEHPDWKSDIIKVGKEIGARWRGLSDSEKAKY